MQRTKNLFKALDSFGNPISLYFYNKGKFTSIRGGLFTLGMIVLLILLSLNMISSIINRTNVTSSLLYEFYKEPPVLNITHRFAIQLSPALFQGGNNKRYFDLTLGLGKFYIDPKKGPTFKTDWYNWAPCNNSHFPNFSPEDFANAQLSTFLCPEDYNQEFLVFGTYDGKMTYQYLEIHAKECQSTGANDICANKSEVESLMQAAGGKIYFGFVILNAIVNFTNYDQPLTYYIQDQSNIFSTSNYKQEEIYLTPVKVQTDSIKSFSIMRESGDLLEVNSFMYDRKIDNYVNGVPQVGGNGQKTFLSLYLRSDSTGLLYKRSYDTFEGYLRFIGSLYSVLALVFSILNNIFARDQMKMKIAKNLYNFNDKDLDKEKSRSLKKKGLFRKIFNYIFSWNKYNYAKKSIKEAVLSELDLVQLLLRIKEITMIKKIIFTKEQRHVFNFLSQPKFKSQMKIKSKHDMVFKRQLEKNSLQISSPSKDKSKDVLFQQNMLNEIKSSIENLKKDQSDFSQKIVRLMDEKDLYDLEMKSKKSLKIKKDSSVLNLKIQRNGSVVQTKLPFFPPAKK